MSYFHLCSSQLAKLTLANIATDKFKDPVLSVVAKASLA